MRNCSTKILFFLLFFSRSFFLLGQKDDTKIISLQAALSNAKNNTERVSVLNDLSEAFAETDANKALKYAEESLNLAQKLNNPKAEINSQIAFAYANFHLNNNSKAFITLQKALSQSEQIGYVQGKVDCLNNLAIISLQTGNRKDANTYIGKAKRFAEDSAYQNGLANAYLNLGHWYLEEDANEALINYQLALKVFRQNNDNLSATKSLYIIAETYKTHKKEANSALSFATQSLSLAESLDEKRWMTDNLNLKGNIHAEFKKDYKTALRNYFQALIVSQEYDFAGNKERAATSLNGIAKCYASLARYAQRNNETSKAAEYDKLQKTYQRMYQSAKESGNSNFSYTFGFDEKIYKSDLNPVSAANRAKLLEIERNRLELDNLAKEKKITLLEASLKKAELRKKEDSIRLLRKDEQLENFKYDQEQNESQIKAFDQQKSDKDNEIKKQRGYTYLWVTVFGVLIVAALFFAFYYYQDQNKVLKEQKDRLLAYNERVNRQEVSLREKEVVLDKKEKELASTYARLDDALVENESFVQMIDEEIKPPIESLIIETSGRSLNRLLIHQSGKQMLNLLTNIIDVKNFDKAKIHLYKDNHPIHKVAESALEQISEILKRKDLKVINQIKPFYYANFDFEVIERVFLSLIANSLKYSPKGELIILDAEPLEEKGTNFLKISVNDSGQVIPKNTLPLVFEKFSPEDARPSALGLSFVKIVVEQHEGKVGVESGSEKGTTFYFTLKEPKSIENYGDDSSQSLAYRQQEQANAYLNPLSVSLSDTEKKMLKPYLIELNQLEFFETTSLHIILNEIESKGNKNIEAWKNALENAIFNLDEIQFKQLTKIN